MSHHHDHNDHHDHHDHHHHNDHDHHHDEGGDALSLEGKLAKLFDHWIRHNDSHAETYRQWQKKAEAEGMTAVAGILEEVSTMTDAITEKLRAGAGAVKS